MMNISTKKLRMILPQLKEFFGFQLCDINGELLNVHERQIREERYDNELAGQYSYTSGGHTCLKVADYILATDDTISIQVTKGFNKRADDIVKLCKEKIKDNYELQKINDKEKIKDILNAYADKYFDLNNDKQTWFDKLKDLAEEFGYAREVKEFKANPENYKGHVGDISTVIRVKLTRRCNTPDLYEIMRILGKDRINNRYSKI